MSDDVTVKMLCGGLTLVYRLVKLPDECSSHRDNRRPRFVKFLAHAVRDTRNLLQRFHIVTRRISSSSVFNAAMTASFCSASAFPAPDVTQSCIRLVRLGTSSLMYLRAIRSWLSDTRDMQCFRMAIIPLKLRKGRYLSPGTLSRCSQCKVLLAQKTRRLFWGMTFWYLRVSSVVTKLFRVVIRYCCNLDLWSALHHNGSGVILL